MRGVTGFGGQVEAFVHAIVQATRGAEDDAGAWRDAAGGETGVGINLRTG